MSKNSMSRYLTLALTFLFFSLKGEANQVDMPASMWNYYFPKTNCQIYECGRNVPYVALEAALKKTMKLTPKNLRRNFLMVIDFSQHSLKKRAYLINTITGQSEAYYVSHGMQSDCNVGVSNCNGYAYYFSNNKKSNMSSLGLYTTQDTYDGEHGLSLHLMGLEETNDNARSRSIVIHSADYMNEAEMIAQGYGGRSQGCPAFEARFIKHIIESLAGGSALYIYAPPQAIQVR